MKISDWYVDVESAIASANEAMKSMEFIYKRLNRLMTELAIGEDMIAVEVDEMIMTELTDEDFQSML